MAALAEAAHAQVVPPRHVFLIDETAAEPIVKAAVDGGVTFFDTADTYSGGASEVATVAGREAADSIDDAFARFDAGVSGATSVV
jgi:hypothetical protein